MKKKLFLSLFAAVFSLVSLGAQSRVGVVLSGGGALGFAHIGALMALEEEGIRPHYIAGASMGSLVGLCYASGMSGKAIYDMVRHEQFDRTLKILAPAGIGATGLASHKNVYKLLDKYVPYNSFDSLPNHFAVSVSNLSEGKCEYVSKGDKLKDYVVASSSIPAVFEAVKIDTSYYVDGGLFDNFPASTIRKQSDLLIGIDVSPLPRVVKVNSVREAALRTLRVLVAANSQPGRELCDYVIDSYAIEQYNEMDFHQFEAIVQYGYEATKNYLQAHPDLQKRARKLAGK